MWVLKKKNEVSTHFQGVSIRIKKRDRKYHYKIGKFEESGRMWCRFHPKILIREFEDLIFWEVSSDYFDFTFIFEKESDDTLYFDEQHSSDIEEIVEYHCIYVDKLELLDRYQFFFGIKN